MASRAADWSDEVLLSFDPYIVWYRRHTRLLVGNPSHLSESRYQGVGPYLETLVVGAGKSYHLAKDALFRRDGQHALQAVAKIRDLLYESIQHAHWGDRLHFGYYSVHSVAAAPDTSVPSTSVPSTSAPAISTPWTSVTPPHATPYISPDSLHIHPTQHTGIPYVADPDWTPPRYMHDDAHIEAPPKREGEAEVMVVTDVVAEVEMRAEVKVEVEVQLQIVIQLHQMREFHNSQQYLILGQRRDQGQHKQEREGHTHRLHKLARDMELSILKSDAKKNGTALNAVAIKAIKDDPAFVSDPELSDCSDSEIADLSED
ncbi:hypothetical protein CsSME_00040973 [Camellia sinensis var. sinensis]